MARLLAAVLTFAASISITGNATSQEFAAKSINLIVGFPPAGGYDSIARIFARHFGKHLPGNPSVVVQNQPGAGSLTAANLLYNAAPKDGSHIAMFASSAALEPLMGNQLAKFDANKFEWLGNLNRDTPACGVWKTSGLKTWDDFTKRKTRFGASGPAAITAQHAFFMKNVLGADIQVIMGLGGTGPIVLAMQRGEVDASCGMFISSVRGPFRNDFEQGNLIIFMQFGKTKEPFFKNAANVYDVVKNEEDRKLAEFVFTQSEVTRPLAMAPGTPPAIVATMRTAFDNAVKDKDYLAELDKAQIDGDPMNGADTAEAFRTAISSPRAIIDRAKSILSPPN